MKPSTSKSRAYSFEALYHGNPDPWNFVGSAYERARHAATLEALPRRSYKSAFEPGCSIGELTAGLARRCDRVIAVDIAPSAVAQARRRCERCPNVHIECADVSASMPEGPFDLVVFSELGYYFSKDDLNALAAGLVARMQSGGDFVAVHWLGHSRDHALHGDTVHELLKQCLPLTWQTGARFDGFRIDTWVRQ